MKTHKDLDVWKKAMGLALHSSPITLFKVYPLLKDKMQGGGGVGNAAERQDLSVLSTYGGTDGGWHPEGPTALSEF